MLRESICVLGEEPKLRLWVRSEPDVELTVAPHQLSDGVAIQGGRSFQVEIDASQAELVLHASTSHGKATWRLALRRHQEPDWLVQARQADPGKRDATRQQLEARLDDLDPDFRSSALRALARLDAQAGDLEASLHHLRQAIEAAAASGRYLEEIECRATLLYHLFYNNQLHEAREVLDAMPNERQPPAEALYHRAFYRAVLANGVGDHQTALRLLDEAARRAERLRLQVLVETAHQLLAVQLQALGRVSEAKELLSQLWDAAEVGSHACHRAQLANNIAWSRLLVLEAGGREELESLRSWLETSLELFRRECPQIPQEPANVETNLALAQLHAGQPTSARQHLENARRLEPTPDFRQLLWQQDIDARIGLDEGQPRQALELYDDMAQLAATTLSVEAEWRSAIGRGRAHQALGSWRAARQDFAHSEALLDSASLQLPIVGDRARFVAQRELGTRLHLELLLNQGLEREAFELARRSRSRILHSLHRSERLAHLDAEHRQQWHQAVDLYLSRRRALDEAVRDAWRLPADQLQRLEAEQADRYQELNELLDHCLRILEPDTPPAPTLPKLLEGDVRLVFHPLPQGWAAFAEDAEGLQVERLPELDLQAAPAELAHHLLEPFNRKIAGAQQVRILAYGDLRSIDFHALPLGEDLLLAFKPVIYGLDLESVPAELRPRARHGVVVADPEGDLTAARLEAQHVRQSAAAPWSVELLQGPEAEAATVREALGAADLFHYAGHGIFAGWQSALPLADGSLLALGDILTLEQPPSRVVLSGCDTGRSVAAPAGAAGLAHAFLAAGSHSVIAATRPIRDDVALALTSALYPALWSSDSVAEALRQAQLELHRKNPDADAWSFRVFEP